MNLLIVAIGSLAAGCAAVFLRHGHVNTLGGVVQLSIVAAIGIFGAAILMAEVMHVINQPAADYELETGEYLRCTQKGDNRLDCEVMQRKDDQ